MENRFDSRQEGLSAWKIWCHPMTARDLIDESALRIMNLENNLEELKSELEEREGLCERLREQLSQRDLELAQAQEELESAREELSLHKSVDEKLAEFDKELEKVERMKRGYEKKIAFLEDLLRRERKRHRNMFEDELAIEDTEDEPDFYPVQKIDMVAPERIDLSESDLPLRKTPEEKNAVEKKKAEEGKKAKELQRAYQEKRAFGLPETLPDSQAPDDWLLELPDNL